MLLSESEDRMNTQLERGLEQLKIEKIPNNAVSLMTEFVSELLEKNKVLNLTAITNPRDVVGLHLLDSAFVSKHIPDDHLKLIDVGTGAGFPGFPLKILRPNLEVTLLDALEKRLVWLEEMSDKLGLEQLYTLHGRGEELSHEKEYRETYDIATARAVADLAILAEVSLPFLKIGGRFLAMKSIDTDEEIQRGKETLSRLGGEILDVVDYIIPELEVTHRLLIIEKVSSTPMEFPRRWKKIKNSPIN